MKAPWLTLVLIVANCVLLALALRVPAKSELEMANTQGVQVESRAVEETANRPAKPAPPPTREPETPFAAIYSADSRQFVQNLRAIGCPEQTIKDILTAEIDRRHAPQEEALRPRPADHVPFGWSAKTSEGKLIARRQEAAAIAREKRAELRAALGYDVAVKMPQYAMTTSDQMFEGFLNSLPSEKRPAAQAIQDDYWAGVQMLRDRTRGFWQADDATALEELKSKRKAALANLGPAQ